ncbi:MAG: UPF0104 family protein [Anaerolineae bacterium]|nr:MAG: UPF0104 family protein [Anaerolineae bacterium]
MTSDFWKNARRWLPGAIISTLLVIAIVRFVDLRAVARAVQHADPLLLLAALALSVPWLGVRALLWRTLLRERASFRDTFLTLGEGYLMNNFLPFRLGEMGRAFLLSRKSELTFLEILPTIVIERVVDLAFSAALLAGAVPFVVGAAGAERVSLVVGGMVLVGLAVLYLMARYREQTLAAYRRLSARWPVVQRFGGGMLTSFLNGLSVLTSPWRFIRFLFWSAFDWLIAVVEYYLIIAAFFPQAHLGWGAFGLGAAAFGGAVPSLPGAVGTFEGAFGGALTLLSGDQSTALAVALTARLYNYLFSGIVGTYALSLEGQTLAGVYRQLRNLRARATDAPPDPPA